MEDQTPTSPPREKNPVTYQAYRREVYRQITIPLVATILVLGLLVLVAVLGKAGAVRNWADISAMLLILIWMSIGLITLAFVIALAFVISRIIDILPYYTFGIQKWLARFEQSTRRLADGAVEPFLRIRSSSAGFREFWRALRRRK